MLLTFQVQFKSAFAITYYSTGEKLLNYEDFETNMEDFIRFVGKSEKSEKSNSTHWTQTQEESSGLNSMYPDPGKICQVDLYPPPAEICLYPCPHPSGCLSVLICLSNKKSAYVDRLKGQLKIPQSCIMLTAIRSTYDISKYGYVDRC